MSQKTSTYIQWHFCTKMYCSNSMIKELIFNKHASLLRYFLRQECLKSDKKFCVFAHHHRHHHELNVTKSFFSLSFQSTKLFASIFSWIDERHIFCVKEKIFWTRTNFFCILRFNKKYYFDDFKVEVGYSIEKLSR